MVYGDSNVNKRGSKNEEGDVYYSGTPRKQCVAGDKKSLP
jgi:hypothetical protein